MKFALRCALTLLWTLSAFCSPAAPTVQDAQSFMDKAEAELLTLTNEGQQAGWVHETFLTYDTDALSAKATEHVIARTTELVEQSKQFDALDLPADLRRKFLLLKLSLGLPAPTDPKLREELTQVAATLSDSYGAAKYCPGTDSSKCMGIDELEVRMAQSRDPTELRDLWIGWHKIAPPMRDRYARFVELSNLGAKQLGFEDTGVIWRDQYDMSADAFSADLERLWAQVEPLYRELHTYVRSKLIQKYGAVASRPDGMIPADLLGNMWAQEWGNIYDLVAPPATNPAPDIGQALAAHHADARAIVSYGEHFFESLGFGPLPPSFWERSMLTRPRDRDVVCHASAWDVDSDADVRLKVCIHGTSDDFITVHHELGHCYYTLAYRQQPFLFRGGANDGFHEAIGDSIALSITPAYLQKVGLARADVPAAGAIPQLLRTALDKVAFLPFGLLIDKWRWEVFSGQVKAADYNKAWWALREKYQGVAPPVTRSEADFDPGAKYHIPANMPYARYFLARIYQFQFYRAMCQAAGYTGPLHGCSFYGSTQAGARLKAMLELGQSKPWPEAMRAMTGQDRGDASALLEYFQPLMTWLQQQNRNQKQGWTSPSDRQRARPPLSENAVSQSRPTERLSIWVPKPLVTSPDLSRHVSTRPGA